MLTCNTCSAGFISIENPLHELDKNVQASPPLPKTLAERARNYHTKVKSLSSENVYYCTLNSQTSTSLYHWTTLDYTESFVEVFITGLHWITLKF